MKRKKQNSTETLFSEARFVVLRTVYQSIEGVSLREIAYRSELSIGAVQTAVKSLLRMKMLTKAGDGQRMVFRLNMLHVEYPLLAALFDMSARQRIRAQADHDSSVNQTMLKTLGEMSRFARDMKEASRGI